MQATCRLLAYATRCGSRLLLVVDKCSYDNAIIMGPFEPLQYVTVVLGQVRDGAPLAPALSYWAPPAAPRLGQGGMLLTAVLVPAADHRPMSQAMVEPLPGISLERPRAPICPS